MQQELQCGVFLQIQYMQIQNAGMRRASPFQSILAIFIRFQIGSCHFQTDLALSSTLVTTQASTRAANVQMVLFDDGSLVGGFVHHLLSRHVDSLALEPATQLKT